MSADTQNTEAAPASPLPAPGATRNDQTVRSFSQFLGALEDGRLHADLTKALDDAIGAIMEAANERGGKPKAGIKLDLSLKLDDGLVEVTGEIKTTLPKADRGRSIFWTTPERNLSRSNPKQVDMFRDVNRASDEPRIVS